MIPTYKNCHTYNCQNYIYFQTNLMINHLTKIVQLLTIFTALFLMYIL